MEKISICFVFLVSLYCSHARVYDCNLDYYYKPGQGCVKCQPCRPGEEITIHCGHNKTGHKTGRGCKPCSLGLTYNDVESRDSCKNCQSCKQSNKVEVKACTLTSNTVCECPKGTYERKDGECVKCSYCCGSNWEQNKNIVPACKDQGLGRCICKPARYCNGKCSVPTTPPVTTLKISTKTLFITTPEISTTAPPQSEEAKHNATKIPSSTVIFKSPGFKPDSDPKAQQKDKTVGPFALKPGWIVLLCLLTVVLGLIAVAWFHKRTRKQISGCFCRKYGVLSPDGETTSVLAEGHYEEQAAEDATNNATPIPPWEEPFPPILESSSASEELYCSCTAKETEEEQMQCTCTMNTSETSIGKLVHSSSSAETITDELQHYCNNRRQETQNSPSPFSSSRVSSPRSDQYCVTSPSTSNCVTPSPSCGRTPDHHRATSSSPSPCVTPSPPRMRSPDHLRVTPTLLTSSPPCGRSPEHRCVTPSSYSACVTPTPPRGRSPDLLSLPISQSHSSFSEDNEICNQSHEHTQQSTELLSIPISVEAYDKEHEASKTTRKSSPSAQAGRNDGRSVGGRKSPSPKKGVACFLKCELQLKEHWPPDETWDTDKDIAPIPASDRAAGHVVMTNSGSDSKDEEIRRLKKNHGNVAVSHPAACKYRPIQRNEDTEHRCLECCPQPDDSFFQLINRERLCLKEEICKELNRSYKELAILGRVESEMAECETSLNPAERVLDRIKAVGPGLKLSEFEDMLRQLKRLDIVQLIQNHHMSCTFCQRNRFDSMV